MKKYIIILMFLIFGVFVSYGQANKTTMEFTGNMNAQSSINKNDTARWFIDLSEFIGFSDADSIYVIIGIDSIRGARNSDSMGYPKIKFRERNIFKLPLGGFSSGRNINDTIISVSNKVFSESLTCFNYSQLYSAQIVSPQIKLELETNFGDTSGINKIWVINYNILLGIKDKE